MSGNSNVITQFVNQAGDARDQSDHVSSDLFGNAHSQGVMTVIVRANTREMKARQKQIGNRYPGGSDAYSLHVHEFDVIIGPKRTGTGGRDYVWGFSSLNGLPFGTHKNVDSLEQSLWFVGISRSNHYTVPDLSKGIQIDKQGFAAIAFGICSIRRRWSTDIYPGDKLVWRLPSFKEARESMMRKTTTRHPSDKLMVVVEPLDWSFLKYALKNVCQLMLRSRNDIGISHRLDGGTGDYGRSNSDVSSNVRTARALKDHTLTVINSGVEVLAMRGLVKIQTPYKKKKEIAMSKLLKTALDFAKEKVARGGGGGMTAPELRAAVATMDVEGKKLSALSLASPEIRNDNNSSQSKFLKAYLEYSEACGERQTDASTLTNCDFDDEFKQPYAFFAHNKDLSKLYSAGVRYVQDETGQPRDLTDTDARTIDVNAKMGKINDALFLSHYLGLVNGGKGEQTKVTHDLLNATHMTFGEIETSMNYLTGFPLGSELNIVASQKQLNMLNDYKKLQEEHLFKLNEEIAKLSQSIEDRRIGTAISHATSGSLDTILDVLVKA
jgi:hypothetical protein